MLALECGPHSRPRELSACATLPQLAMSVSIIGWVGLLKIGWVHTQVKHYLQQGTSIVRICSILVAQLAAGSRVVCPDAQKRPRRRVPPRQLGQLGGRVKCRQRHLQSPSHNISNPDTLVSA